MRQEVVARVSESVAQGLVAVVGSYLAIGAVFAAAFVSLGVGRIDPAARSGSLGFRLLIFPGSAALWPLLARRWLRGQTTPPEESDAHTRGRR